MRAPFSAALVSLLLVAGVAIADGNPARDGRGWLIEKLDVDVHVEPSAGRMIIAGRATLRLDAIDTSFGPTLYANTRKTESEEPVVTFRKVACPDASVEIRNDDDVAAEVRFDSSRKRGDRVDVDFELVAIGAAGQIAVTHTAAIASWTTAWHPFTNPTAEEDLSLTARVLSTPGRTTLRLPAGWVGLVDGELVERRKTDEATVETWRSEKVARSFVAGRYETTTERAGDREVRVYLLPGEKAISRERLAQLIAAALEAQEKYLGPYPFASYGVVEFPDDVPNQHWYAASQQTFITAKSSAFDYEHGNLPLWGHEMCHGWWGNTVGSAGDGAKWCGESLAQLGAYIAIEEIEGADALSEFLRFSRDGYSSRQCAAGYFMFVRRYIDMPIATMGNGPGTHTLADSKGSWIYHMLRRKIGDDRFFGVLRDVIRDEAGRRIDVQHLRRRFIEAAPDADLETFFSQWLDRTGAPVLDLDWHADDAGEAAIISLEQRQGGPPFVFDLDIAIDVGEEKPIIETVSISEASHRFTIATPSRPLGVILDPNDGVLIWRPEYGPRPFDDGEDGLPVSAELREAIVGPYIFERIGKRIDVFERDGVLYARPAGAPEASRLFYRGGDTFHVDTPGGRLVQEFDLSTTPSPSFTSYEGGRSYVATRVDESEE